MTELMKRYEAETGNEVQSDAFAQHEIWEYIRWLESQLTDQTLEKFQEIIRNQCDEISALKAQLTWRPVSKGLPEEAGLYFVEAKPYTGCESKIITTAYFNGERFLWHTVVSYFPIPTSPEGEVK